MVQNVNGMVVKTHFYLPGLQKWSQTIGNSYANPLDKTSWIQIDESVGGVNLISSTTNINGSYNFFFMITKGTNMNVKIVLPTNEKINFTADIMRLSYGLDLPLFYSAPANSCCLLAGFIIKQVVLTYGYLTKLKLKVAAIGTLEVAILRPTSSNYFKVSLLNKSRVSNVSRIVTAVVVKKIMFLLNDTGVIEIPITNKNSDIQENDMVWIGGSGSLFCNGENYEPMTGVQLGKTITFSTYNASNDGLFISFFISKPFKYLIPMQSNKTGLFNLFSIVSNYIPSFHSENYSFPIQTPVSGLQFVNNTPYSKNVAGYKLNSLISLQVVIDKGSDVMYSFDIPMLNYSKIVSSGYSANVSNEVHFQMTTLGVFTVIVTAANKLNSVNTSISVSVLSEINALYLNVVKEQLQSNSYNTTVTILNGTEVLMKIDFGDGTPLTNLTNIIGIGVGGYTYITNHTYSECNVYTITVWAANYLVLYNRTDYVPVSTYKNVTVFCLMSPLNKKTIPMVSLNRVYNKEYVKLSLGNTFVLNINQDIGSYRNFSIDWGDGSFSYNNQSVTCFKEYFPVSFQLTHLYSENRTYNLVVVSSNALENRTVSIYIDVKYCSVPYISFNYGNISNPITIVRSSQNDITGVLDDIRPTCVMENTSFQWNLSSSVSFDYMVGSLSQKLINYRMNQNSFGFGFYTLLLNYTYGEDFYHYTGYINVKYLPLFINIEKGFFAAYAYEIKIGNFSFFENFTISAMSSYDPDDRASGIENITFVWSCKVATDFALARTVKANFSQLGTNYSSDTCFTDTWMNISSNEAQMNFSTQQFLEGINYHFKVCGTKIAGKDIYKNDQIKSNCFVQEILIIAREVPTISLICIANCDTKLNFKERLIYSFYCSDCDLGRLFAKWTIFNDQGIIPSEISQGNATTTGFRTPSLVVNKDVLLESTNYTFTLLVGYKNAIKRAEFVIKKTTCSKPTRGTCYIFPLEGSALDTNFTLFCYDWYDSDGFLSYMFLYDNGQAQHMNLSSTTTLDYPVLSATSTGLSSLINFIMGPGDKNNMVRIIIRISGKYKAYTEVILYIKVNPNKKLMNVTDLLSKVDTNDVQSVASLAQAISYNTNKNSVKYGNVTGGDNVTNDQQLSSLIEARTQVINLLNNVSIKDINSFKSISDALVVTSQHPHEVEPHAQNQAGDIIVRLAGQFTKDNFVGFGADHFDSMTQSFVNSISNLFQAGLNQNLNSNNTGLNSNNTTIANETSAAISTKSPSLSSNITQGDPNLVSKLSKSLDNYFLLAQSFKVPGEKSTVGETNQFKFIIKKDFSIDLSNKSIGSSDGGFSFPDSGNMFNESVKNSQILIHNIRMKNIVYTWDTNRSKKILTESQSLSFSNEHGLPIEVRNSSKPINVAIKNNAEKLLAKKIPLLMPNDLYQVKLPLELDCNMLLKFGFLNDENNLTNLIVYIQYGKIATKLDYDIMLSISVNDGVVMTKNYNLTVNTFFNNSAYKYNETLKRNQVHLSNDSTLLNFNSSSNNKTMNSSEVVKNNITTENTTFSDINADQINTGLQRNQDAYVNDDSTIVLWNFKNATYAFLNNRELHLTFSYSGPMPPKILDLNPYTFDQVESSGTFDYEMKSYCVECNYWNEYENSWMSDGCQLDYQNTTFLVTKCKCNHLTTFGGFFVSPNPPPKLSFAKLKSGYTLLLTVVIIILLWILGLLLARRIDNKDASKVGVCPLLDNLPNDNYLYEIVVNTGNRRNAGTKSNIYCNIIGDINESSVRRLKDPERECFQRSSCDVFIMTTQSTLGDIEFIQIWHDNSGGGWFLRNVEITDLQTGKKSLFVVQSWIAVDRGTCLLHCTIPVTSVKESSNFTYVFKTKVHNKFLDEHLWFSIIGRPPKSNFTRCQRLSVAVSLIMTSMMVSVLFYQRVPPSAPVIENKFGKISFNLSMIFILLVSTAVKFPVQLILVSIFRTKVRKSIYLKNNSNDVLESLNEKNEAYEFSEHPSEHFNYDASNISCFIETKKEPAKIPKVSNLGLYIGWFICAGNIFACGFIVLIYGMEFGNQKSLNWLSSITIDFVKEVFLTEPLKILLLSIVVAVVVKKVEETIEIEKEGEILAQDEVWLHQRKHEESIFESKKLMQPLDSAALKSMKELRLKQQKMYAIIRELACYTLYAFLVFFIGYMTRGAAVFYQNRNVNELFNLQLRQGVSYPDDIQYFKKIQSSQDFWNWMENFFLNQVYPQPWYNLSKLYTNTDKKDFPGKLFLNDLTSKIVNGIRIRQVRVKSNSCLKANVITEHVKLNCLSEYQLLSEETRDFYLNWTFLRQNTSIMDPSTTPWIYQTWKQLDGYPYAGDLAIYNGGGYVVEIFPKWKNKVALDKVKELKWIDRQTRAVIVEFALYNGATEYFNMVIMTFEFPVSGGVVPNFSIITFNLHSSFKALGITLLAFHALFILMLLVITVRECRFLYRAGWAYFLEFWNLLEVAIIIFSYIAVGFFFYKDYLGKLLLERLPAKKPQTFINFQFASYWHLIYLNIVAIIVFIVTLKFIKLLRFNRRISMLSSTLKAAWYPLSMFGIIFFIVICSFVFSCNIVFGAFIDGYQTYFKTIVSIVSLLLGKFSYSQFGNANPALGPIFFLVFNVTVIWIVMNMFVSILNDVFEAVCENVGHQSNDYEMVDFIFQHFKDWLGYKSINKEQCLANDYTGLDDTSGYTGLDSTSGYTGVKKVYEAESDIDENLNSTVEEIVSKNNNLLKEGDRSELLDKFVVCMKLTYNATLKKEKNNKLKLFRALYQDIDYLLDHIEEENIEYISA